MIKATESRLRQTAVVPLLFVCFLCPPWLSFNRWRTQLTQRHDWNLNHFVNVYVYFCLSRFFARNFMLLLLLLDYQLSTQKYPFMLVVFLQRRLKLT